MRRTTRGFMGVNVASDPTPMLLEEAPGVRCRLCAWVHDSSSAGHDAQPQPSVAATVGPASVRVALSRSNFSPRAGMLKRPVHVCGIPQSGTSLTRQMDAFLGDSHLASLFGLPL